MGVYLKLVNFTNLFNRSPQPVIINDLSRLTEEDKEKVDRLISTSYKNTDLFSNEPTCECGAITGAYNKNVICKNCDTPVVDAFDQELKPVVWLRSPNGVAPLMNPMVWTMLTAKFTKSNFNLIEWLCNTDYQPAVNKPAEVQQLIDLGVIRGYNNFYENFHGYLDILFSLKAFAPKKGQPNSLLMLLKANAESVFSTYIPIPNKALMVVESTHLGTFIDPIVIGARDAILMMCGIDTPDSLLSNKQKQNRAAKTINMWHHYYYETYHTMFAGKPGICRKHIFGTRQDFSCRAVISSNTVHHNYDEISIPWGAGVTMLKIHLSAKLFRLGYTSNAAAALLQKHTYTYHPLLDQLFKELIDESPDKGLWCTFGRNPSLSRGSAQRMKIPRVKTDPNDPTITLSALSVKSYNA